MVGGGKPQSGGGVPRKSRSSPKAIHDPRAKCQIPACSGIWNPPNKLLLRSRGRGAAQLGCHTSRWDQTEALWGKTETHRLWGGLKGRTEGGSACDPVWLLGMKNNSVHIGNHLYFENQKRWGAMPDDLPEVFYSRGTSIPNKNPDDCQTCFFFISQYSAYSVRNLKIKQNGLVPSLNCQTSGCYFEHTGPRVQVKMWKTTHSWLHTQPRMQLPGHGLN